MLEELQKISFRPLWLYIKFLAQSLVDLLISPLAIDEFPNPYGNRVLQSIEVSDLRSRLLDGHKKDHPLDHSPGKQWILFESLVDELFQLLILDFPDVGPTARLA